MLILRGDKGERLTLQESDDNLIYLENLALGASGSSVNVSGYNYIICETENTGNPAADALANGVNLIAKYTEAVSLNIGSKEVDNRAVLLLMPGDYDLDDATLQLEPFVDVIGISTNAADTIIRMSDASAGQLTIDWQNSDAMVSNVDIRADVANDGIAIGGGNNSYVKLENVIFGSDNPTSNSDGSIKSFNDFNGELNRIRFSELLITDFLWVDGNINGTFKDIVIGDVDNYAFVAENGDINGIFKDINIGNVLVSFSCYQSGNIGFDSVNSVVTDTIFENIKIGEVSDTAFYAPTGEINGVFKDINIVEVLGAFFYAENYINGTYKNITCGDINYGFISNVADINGTFKDIIVGNITGDNIFYAPSGNIGFDSVNSVVTDTIFENIRIGNVDGFTAFSASGDINGTFKDIVIGNVGTIFEAANIGFDSVNSVATDTIFENIKIGNVTSEAFFVYNDMNGTFKDIVIGNVTSDAFFAIAIVGTFKNIIIGNVTGDAFYAATGDINGTFKDIVIGNVSNAFYADGYIGNDNINVTLFENIKIGDVDGNYAFYAGIDIFGTFRDIVIGNVTGNGAFYAIDNIGNDTNIVTEFENIKIGDVSNFLYAQNGSINGTFKNIIIGSVSGNISNYAFFAGVDIIGTFKDIVIGNFSSGEFFYAGNSIGYNSVNNVATDTIFENIKIGDVNGSGIQGSAFIADTLVITGTFRNIVIDSISGNVFYSNVTINATFVDIVIGDVTNNAFYAVSGVINGTFKNIVVGNVTSYAFYAPLSGNYSGCTFININCAKAFQQDTFNGKIYDTTIDATGLVIDGIRDLASGAIIERCKFIVDSGNVSINTQDILGVTAQILYTITNEGISSDITPPGTNYNIDDPNIV